VNVVVEPKPLFPQSLFLTSLETNFIKNLTTEIKKEEKAMNLSNEEYTYNPKITKLSDSELERRRQCTIKLIQKNIRAKQRNFAVKSNRSQLYSNRSRAKESNMTSERIQTENPILL